MNKAEAYVKALESCFARHADPKRAVSMEKYMLNQFTYFGLSSSDRRNLSKEFIGQNSTPSNEDLRNIVKLLWMAKQRELQYFAMELLEKEKKSLGPDDLELFEFMILHKSWWDTVDFIAPKLVGFVLKGKIKETRKWTGKWRKTDNIWLKRSTLLFQMKYKSDTDTGLLFDLIAQYAEEKEFFIRKAIGWSLREHTKTDPDLVIDFVDKQKLSNLSKKEALKRVSA